MRRCLETEFFEGLSNFFLFGDSGYLVQLWLMIPILVVQEDTFENHYKRAHSDRSTIEKSIGILKS